MSGRTIKWHRAITRRKLHSARGFGRSVQLDGGIYRPRASTFREDPLPDRPVTHRGVTLAHVAWLDRPDPETNSPAQPLQLDRR